MGSLKVDALEISYLPGFLNLTSSVLKLRLTSTKIFVEVNVDGLLAE